MNIEILIKNVKDNFLEVYPEISFDFDSDEHDGQNAFEVALGESGFFDIEDDLDTIQYDELYDELFDLIDTP